MEEIDDFDKYQAEKRRKAFNYYGCRSYELRQVPEGLAILCLCCGCFSFYPSDIEQKYCIFCEEFHRESD